MSDGIDYLEKGLEELEELLTSLFPTSVLSDGFKNGSLRNFLSRLPRAEVTDALWLKYAKSSEEHAKAA